MAAPKKTETTKAAPKVTAKKADKKVDYAKMDVKDLQKALATKQQDLLDSRRSHKGGELVNPRVLAATRKEIARIMTALNAAEAAQKESK